MQSIYNEKTRFLVVDIETCKQSSDFIFDIAYGVYSRKEGMIGVAGYIVEENRDMIPYYADRLKRYEDYLTSGEYTVKPYARIMAEMAGIIKKYAVSYGVAYNSAFDFSKIKNTCNQSGVYNPLGDLVEIDLYNTACQTLGKQKYYKAFVERNAHLKTEKGNRKTNAETFYGYMTQNPQFIEEHTGRGDVLIEAEILERILRQKKKMDIKPNKKAWRAAQG